MAALCEIDMPIPNSEQPELLRLLDELHALNKLAIEAGLGLTQFLSRLRGPVPESAESGACGPCYGDGVIGELQRATDKTRDSLNEILGSVRALQRIG